MKWTQQQLTTYPVSYAQQTVHSRFTETYDHDYVMDLIAGCTEDAEDQMNCSLLTRTVTATFFQHDRRQSYLYGYTYGNTADQLRLPRGPVQAITSVTDANGTILSSDYSLVTFGTADFLKLRRGFVPPLVVVYQAGYADTPDLLPVKFRNAIRTHVQTLYENRESISDKTMVAIPHSLELFWQRNNRGIPIA